ncbi:MULTISPECIES: class I SAM-dependent rRNA methyltransferase [unclassified Streptococcus]|uniref:class I SAM-dependent rRNA methyltransferase n=1 Tax=unclassified Streptococcus TaxID=2608887 RepID=UPI00359E726A
MFKLFVSPSAEKKILSGVQVLEGQDLLTADLPEGLVTLYSNREKKLASAYLSPQQRGIGWVLPQAPVQLDKAYFVSLFEAAKVKRQVLEHSNLTTAYRLFNQDGDCFGGLTIDRYGDYALFSWYNSFVYSLKNVIVSAFLEVFPDMIGGYEKCRFQGASHISAHIYGQEAPEQFTILENGVSYNVFLNDGLMTGIFLDQHEVRGALVDGLAAGKSVINMFSYTAAFSVAAAIGGASETTSVDLAKRSRELSAAHFTANGLALSPHRFIVMDVFDYCRYAKKKGLSYDMIILDPPSFARNKKQTFSVAKDYHKLMAQAVELLADGGLIIASTNASNLSLRQFRQQIHQGMGRLAYREISRYQLPSDFTVNPVDARSNYLKVIIMEVIK